ncbi:MAG: Uma2 family endonuclease [Saprospiraceae bacterium]|nr:Uma2 family endonuclease [Saprospiraceae bacterium]
MLDNNSIEDSLWNVPSLPLLLDRIHHRLDDERLKRSEFRSWLTEDTKAEFINGSVLMHSPAADDHNEASGQLYRASLYADINNLGKVRVEKALVGMTRNDYEPDIAFWRKEVADRFEPAMNVYPVPDLIVEVLSPAKKTSNGTQKPNMRTTPPTGCVNTGLLTPRNKRWNSTCFQKPPPKSMNCIKGHFDR